MHKVVCLVSVSMYEIYVIIGKIVKDHAHFERNLDIDTKVFVMILQSCY